MKRLFESIIPNFGRFSSKVGEKAYKISENLSQSGTKNIRAPKPNANEKLSEL
jgi:hypothetical protein